MSRAQPPGFGENTLIQQEAGEGRHLRITMHDEANHSVFRTIPAMFGPD
jgi:hypothetical protein